MLSKGQIIVPVIGVRKRTQLEASLGALAVTLFASDPASIEKVQPPFEVAGTRYGEQQMKPLGS